MPPETVEQLIELRQARKTYRQIAQTLGLAVSTVARHLKQAGLNRLAELEPAPPIVRYQFDRPGELLHLDIKKLGRFWKPGHRVTGNRQQASEGAGWEYVHVAIDDHSRVAFTCIHPDETGRSACQALLQAVRYYRALGIRFTRVMTDNGSCYKSRRFRRLCKRLGLRHIRTKPYTPRTNGKAERFIQTSLREWAYARSYDSSEQRAAHLLPWLHHYNWHRPHASLDYNPPISRVSISLNNVLGLHT
jgi:transposase InsO family protein